MISAASICQSRADGILTASVVRPWSAVRPLILFFSRKLLCGLKPNFRKRYPYSLMTYRECKVTQPFRSTRHLFAAIWSRAIDHSIMWHNAVYFGTNGPTDGKAVGMPQYSPNPQNAAVTSRHHSLVGRVWGFCSTCNCPFPLKHFFLAHGFKHLLNLSPIAPLAIIYCAEPGYTVVHLTAER